MSKQNPWKSAVGSIIDKSGMHYSSGPPEATAFIEKPTYSFTIDGVDRKATDVCAEYLGLLDRMVEEFKRDHP